MAKRGELTNAAWARLRPLLPLNGKRGGQWRDHRRVSNGILWRLRVGAPWRDVPTRYGPWPTCYDRFVRWRRDGTWDRLLAHFQAEADASGAIAWVVCIDGTVVRAHQHAAGARGQPSRADKAAKVAHPADEALGRSRGGLTTKIHLACDGRGRPLSVVLTPGQRHESTQLGAVLDAIRVPRPGGRGRPRKRPRPHHRRQGLQLRDLPTAVAPPRHPAHHPRAAGPAPAARGPAGASARLRRRALPAQERRGALRQPAQAVARGRHARREAGS